jgi:hypothetical protein
VKSVCQSWLGAALMTMDGNAPDLGQLFHFQLWHEVAVTCALISLYVFAWMSPKYLKDLKKKAG